jgi:hypothetical protein
MLQIATATSRQQIYRVIICQELSELFRPEGIVHGAVQYQKPRSMTKSDVSIPFLLPVLPPSQYRLKYRHTNAPTAEIEARLKGV